MGLKPLNLQTPEVPNHQKNLSAEWACGKINEAIKRKQWVDITVRIENGTAVNVHRVFKEVYRPKQ